MLYMVNHQTNTETGILSHCKSTKDYFYSTLQYKINISRHY